MTSRAVQFQRFGGSEVLEVVDRDDPTPGAGQVLLDVRIAGVNPLDWKIRSGFMASGDAPDGPTVPGYDVAGVVAALGPGTSGFEVGDEVLGYSTTGAYAERALADATRLVPKPDTISWEVAGSLASILTTSYRVLALLGLGADQDATGKTLVVDGASGAVGVIVTQLAVARGATVIGTASEAHQDDVRALGATPVVYGDGLADRVRAVAGQGVDTLDRALDTAGKGSLPDLIALTGSTDRVITIADPTAGEHGVRFSAGGADQDVPGALADGVALVAAGTVRPPSTVTYPLDQAGRAQDDNQQGRVSGKLVLSAARP